ncbi:hypothetical protein DFO53_4244 [Enterobacter sp. AG5470]|nr:hypothetical protein DFO53_4244 [Enterobacter sp. AG5470]
MTLINLSPEIYNNYNISIHREVIVYE